MNRYELKNVAGFQLFDLSENDKRGRLKKHTPPREYLIRREQLTKASAKELINELNKRKKVTNNGPKRIKP